jgi:DNA-binding CsgD family transcriptional regulator
LDAGATITFGFSGYDDRSMTPAAKSRRALREVLLYSLAGGVLITLLRLTEYRFLIVEHSVEIYAGLIAALFAALGIWLGLTLTRKKTPIVIQTAQQNTPCTPDARRLTELAITPRELEILNLIAAGLSNREIAGRLFVSENTVKTHSSRLFDKLGAKRRTQAVQLGKEARLIP